MKVGTSTLLFPIQFREVGIGTSFIISIIIAIISTKTNVLIIKHNKTEEVTLLMIIAARSTLNYPEGYGAEVENNIQRLQYHPLMGIGNDLHVPHM